jgi:hypothetical protein
VTTIEITDPVLPTGSTTLLAWEDDILRALIGAPRGVPEPHPLWALTAAVRGAGADIDGILARADFTVDQGPMVASCAIEYETPLRFDVAYDVPGRILDVERKVGRRTGPFDLLTFELALAADEVTATRLQFKWVLPRRNDHV